MAESSLRTRPYTGRAFALTVILLCLSLLIVGAGVEWGRAFVPPGQGYPPAAEAQPDLFRFDSYYYLEIAEHGYAYNGDPASSPNIVFAPLFPVLASSLSAITGLPVKTVGFQLNEILLFLALSLLYVTLRDARGSGTAFLTVLALATGAGAYALHAFYSESTMLFFLALALRSWQTRRWLALALATAALGASRLAAFPFVLGFSVLFFVEAWRARARKAVALALVSAGIAVWAGLAGYLGYIAMRFGEPFSLLSEIQGASWGLFHPPADAFDLLTGRYLARDVVQAAGKGWSALSDIQTLNLIWMLLGLLSGFYFLLRYPRRLWTWLFVPYIFFIYISGAASPYLISVHRFMLFMLPIFLMFADLHQALARRTRVLAWSLTLVLLAVNAAYGVFHAAYFNQGVWYYF